jgi:hypothetical protein
MEEVQDLARGLEAERQGRVLTYYHCSLLFKRIYMPITVVTFLLNYAWNLS